MLILMSLMIVVSLLLVLIRYLRTITNYYVDADDAADDQVVINDELWEVF
jgi:ABC-type cobalt transport system substrate-binding protein